MLEARGSKAGLGNIGRLIIAQYRVQHPGSKRVAAANSVHNIGDPNLLGCDVLTCPRHETRRQMLDPHTFGAPVRVRNPRQVRTCVKQGRASTGAPGELPSTMAASR